MKKLNNYGLTLVELLAVIVISSIVLILTFNILSTVTENQTILKDKNAEFYDSTYFLKVVTKDIRKANDLNANNTYVLSSPNHGDVEYSFENQKILRNGVEILKNVEYFSINKVVKDNNETEYVEIKIKLFGESEKVWKIAFRGD